MAPNGHATLAPMSAMNSRRFIVSSPMVVAVRWLVAAVAVVAVAGIAYAEDLSPKNRVELKLAELSVLGACPSSRFDRF